MSKKTIWQNYLKKYVSDKKISNLYDKFFDTFEEEWNKYLSIYDFKCLAQLNNGNRLRPMLVYWGYLINKNDKTIFVIDNEELYHIIKYCISVESIHKVSLLIDDLIDNDIARHGQTTFHMLHGTPATILTAINIIMKGFLNLYEIPKNMIDEKQISNNLFLLLSTVFEMTIGALEEVTMDNNSDDIDIVKVKNIINKETASIIKYGLVLGYKIGLGNNKLIENNLTEIGECCGYIFQALNDLEPFSNIEILTKHKGRLSIDFVDNRKNIVIAYIFSLAHKNEIKILKNLKETQKIYETVLFYIEKYKIVSIIFEEIEILTEKIEYLINEINQDEKCNLWSQIFSQFIKILIKASKNRALEKVS